MWTNKKIMYRQQRRYQNYRSVLIADLEQPAVSTMDTPVVVKHYRLQENSNVAEVCSNSFKRPCCWWDNSRPVFSLSRQRCPLLVQRFSQLPGDMMTDRRSCHLGIFLLLCLLWFILLQHTKDTFSFLQGNLAVCVLQGKIIVVMN